MKNSYDHSPEDSILTPLKPVKTNLDTNNKFALKEDEATELLDFE
jgi:hypothetical protein